MSLFIDHTKRSAAELSADLSACRQFRHVSRDYHKTIIERTFLAAAKCWIGREAIKHPNPNNLCTNCGKPRSKFSTGVGLCYRCYASDGINTRELWVEDVFLTAVQMRGFTCDACGQVAEPQEDERRNAVIRMLENIDGAVKPILCPTCAQDFKRWCSSNYGRGSWRTAHFRDVEKMALGWFAQKVKVLAEKS